MMDFENHKELLRGIVSKCGINLYGSIHFKLPLYEWIKLINNTKQNLSSNNLNKH